MQRAIFSVSSAKLKQCSPIYILVKQLNDNCQSYRLLFFFFNLTYVPPFGCVVWQVALASCAVNLLYSFLIQAFSTLDA